MNNLFLFSSKISFIVHSNFIYLADLYMYTQKEMNGVDPPPSQMFLLTHKKKKGAGDFVDKKSKVVWVRICCYD